MYLYEINKNKPDLVHKLQQLVTLINYNFISFETAKHVFVDDKKLIAHNRIVDGEERYQVIGKIGEVIIIMVVFTPRNGTIRIISARPANKKERLLYEKAK